MIRRVFVITMILTFIAGTATAGLIKERNNAGSSSLLRRDGGAAGRSKATISTKRAPRRKVDRVNVPRWKRTSMSVTSRYERRFDENRDGYLQPDETKSLLQERYSRLKRQRNPRVVTPAEQQYDFNNNEIFEDNELKALSQDI